MRSGSEVTSCVDADLRPRDPASRDTDEVGRSSLIIGSITESPRIPRDFLFCCAAPELGNENPRRNADSEPSRAELRTGPPHDHHQLHANGVKAFSILFFILFFNVTPSTRSSLSSPRGRSKNLSVSFSPFERMSWKKTEILG